MPISWEGGRRHSQFHGFILVVSHLLGDRRDLPGLQLVIGGQGDRNLKHDPTRSALTFLNPDRADQRMSQRDTCHWAHWIDQSSDPLFKAGLLFNQALTAKGINRAREMIREIEQRFAVDFGQLPANPSPQDVIDFLRLAFRDKTLRIDEAPFLSIAQTEFKGSLNEPRRRRPRYL